MSEGRKTIETKEAPVPIGPYSQAVRLGAWLYLSGQTALDPVSGGLVAGGVREQTERVLLNLGAVLKAAGAGFESVVKTTVFMTDLSRFSEMNEVYARYFHSSPPARSTVQVAALPKGGAVEIEAVAYVEPGPSA